MGKISYLIMANKLKRFVTKKGIKLRSGYARTVFLYNNKVYKISHSPNTQTSREEHIYKIIPTKFLIFFPKTIWCGKIIITEYITSAQEIRYKGTIYDFIKKKHPEDLKLFQELVQWFENNNFAYFDFIKKGANFGLDKNEKVKIIDWGGVK